MLFPYAAALNPYESIPYRNCIIILFHVMSNECLSIFFPDDFDGVGF